MFAADAEIDARLPRAESLSPGGHARLSRVFARCPVAVAVVVVLVLASAMPLVLALSAGSPSDGRPWDSPAAGPVISLAPSQGPAGSPFTVDGSDFTPDNASNVTFEGELITPTGGSECSFVGPNITVDPSGGFSCDFTVPTVTPGSYDVVGSDNATSTSTEPVTFIVTSIAIELVPTQGPVASTFDVIGTGFTESGTANFTFNGIALVPFGGVDCAASSANINVDANGGFDCSFRVPNEHPGVYDVSSEDEATGNSSSVATFAVTAPAITLNPAQGPSGLSVNVSGSGYTPGAGITLSISSGASLLTSCGAVVAVNGTFNCTVAIKGTASATPYTVNATGSDGSFDSATAALLITTPTIHVTPPRGPSGASPALSGTGFTPGSTILSTIEETGAAITSCGATVSPNGDFDCNVTITSSTPASYTVKATGSDASFDSATAAYRVTAQTLLLSPDRGPSGVTANASGTGFTPGVTVTTTISSGASISNCGVFVSATGAFTCSVTITSSTPAAYTVTATGSDGTFDRTSVSFTLTKPAVTLAPKRGPSGVTSNVSGTGFTPDSTVAMSIETGASISGCPDANVSSSGAFSCSVTITSSTPSGYSVTATGSDGGSDYAIATFTVTAPSLTLAPTQGPSGVAVTASGTGFTPSVTITFTISSGGTVVSPSACSSASSGSFSDCTFAITGATASYTVAGTGSDGEFDSASRTFMVTTPAISLDPSLGPSGVESTVSGTGFSPDATIAISIETGASISGCSSTTVSSSGDFSCQVSISSSTPGTYTVTATGSDGSFDQAVTSFDVTPQKISLSPDQGPSGVTVDLTGTGFTPGATVTTSINDGASIGPCGAKVNGSGGFQCLVIISGTSSATPYTVTATGSDGPYDSTTATFTITTDGITLSPAQGPSGVSSTVTGSGFTPGATVTTSISDGATVTDCGATVLAAGGFSCTVTVSSATAGGYTVTATGSDGSFDSASATFTVTATGISLAPALGPSGATSQISGSGFTPDVAITITIGAGATVTGCSSTTVSSAGTFSCTATVTSTTPATYTVRATGSDGPFDNATSPFQVTVPAITLSPTQGPSGVLVLVSGFGFTPEVSVTTTIGSGALIGDCDATVLPSGAFSCSVTITSSTPSGYTVTAMGSNGAFDSASATFTLTTPSISLTPSLGPSGVAVVLAGTGFTPGVTVLAAIESGASISHCGATVDSIGEFSCNVTITSSTAGAYVVTVSGSDGSFDDASAAFTVTTPTIALSPTQGPTGVSVTISGTGFTPGAVVATSVSTGASIGDCNATVDSAGAFDCAVTISSGTPAGYTVTATGSDGSFDLATRTFTVTLPEITLSASQGGAGSLVTVTGSGFTVGSSATVRFSGTLLSPTSCTAGSFSGTTVTTDSFGGFSCVFVVPSVASGSYTLVATDGSTAATTNAVSFTVPAPSPPSSSFPSWIAWVVAVIILAALAAALYFVSRRRRSLRRPKRSLAPSATTPRASPAPPSGGLTPWQGPVEPAPEVTVGPAPLVPAAEVPAATPAEATAAPAKSVTADDIDELIARLERISVEIYKRTPKELANLPSTEEGEGRSDDPDPGY